jgi:hypothetical protein
MSKKQYTIQLEEEFMEKVDALANQLGLSRSQMMRNLMMSGYDDAIMLEKTGLFNAFKFGQKVLKKIKEGIASGKIGLDKDGDIVIHE